MKLTSKQIESIYSLAEQFGQDKTAEILNIDIAKMEKKDPDEYRKYVDTWTSGRVETLSYTFRRLKEAMNDSNTRMPAVLAYLSRCALEPDVWNSDPKNLAGGKRIKIELS